MDRYIQTKKVAILGIIANIILLILKLGIGFISRSQAMIADGFNSAGDVFASVMTFAGNRIASRPEDKDHPYGHGKAEYIFSMIISFSLVLVAYQIFSGALQAILNKSEFVFSIWLVGVAIVTILSKAVLYIYTRKIGKKHKNLLVLANSEDHRNDVLVTTSTLIGIITGLYGIYWVDGAVGIGISIWIAFTGFRIFLSAYKVLMDTGIDDKLKKEVEETVQAVNGVDHIDSIAAKPVGVGFIIIIKVSVNGNMTVFESHRIAGIVREEVRECSGVKDVVVHINPV